MGSATLLAKTSKQAAQMNQKRCPWSAGVSDIYLRYHDEEWGVPVWDDQRQFEFLILEFG